MSEMEIMEEMLQRTATPFSVYLQGSREMAPLMVMWPLARYCLIVSQTPESSVGYATHKSVWLFNTAGVLLATGAFE